MLENLGVTDKYGLLIILNEKFCGFGSCARFVLWVSNGPRDMNCG